MMVMTAKVNLKKILLGLIAAAALILALILMLGKGDTAQTAAPAPSANDGRVKFLTDFGWDVTTSPTESGRVRIPEQSSEAFDRYNILQKGQGYDLSKYAGKTVMRYVYQNGSIDRFRSPRVVVDLVDVAHNGFAGIFA